MKWHPLNLKTTYLKLNKLKSLKTKISKLVLVRTNNKFTEIPYKLMSII